MADSVLSKPASGANEAALAGERPFGVARIDHVVLRCRDVNAMLEFYCTLLGLEVAKRNERLGLVHLRAGATLHGEQLLAKAKANPLAFTTSERKALVQAEGLRKWEKGRAVD